MYSSYISKTQISEPSGQLFVLGPSNAISILAKARQAGRARAFCPLR